MARFTNKSQFEDLRHTCEQDEGMAGYGWTTYDVRSGGIQIVNDTINQLDLITNFAKISNDGHYGGWGLRIKGIPRSATPEDQKTTVIFYLGSQNPTSRTECVGEKERGPSNSGVFCEGTTPGLGDYKVHIPAQPFDNSSFRRTSVRSLSVPADKIWEAKTIFTTHVEDSRSSDSIISNEPGKGNLHFVQQSFDGEFEFDILFSTDAEVGPMTPLSITEGIHSALSQFNQRFQLVYAPQAPFHDEQYLKLSQSLLSNLMGGLGFFYGTSKVAAASAPDDAETSENFGVKASSAQSSAAVEDQGPYELFSTVPSRPFFPRGFLWDEGFHLQVVLDWDMDLALEVLLSWLELMDDEGWIAREQILGPEARSKVPPEFRTQYRHYANPPTLFFIVREFLARLSGKTPYAGAPSRFLSDPEAGKTFLTALAAKLSRQYEWFRRTQAGNTSRYHIPGYDFSEGYRWRGWTSEHILTGGLDDYPRAQPPHPEGLHLDALCWVGFMTMILKDIAAFLGDNESQSKLSREERAIALSIDALHWSEADQAYCDATIAENGRKEMVCHKGYVSLYPFLLGLIQGYTHVEAFLDLIQDSEELWTPHGLRSLSLKDEYYGTGENYWKGPIWININYMVLQSLLVSVP